MLSRPVHQFTPGVAEGPSEAPAAFGRRRATTVALLSHTGLQLFLERGFEATTVDDIAAAAGIGRRTFFRYFASKNDLPWGDFDLLIGEMRDRLDRTAPELPLFEALRAAVLDFNSYPEAELPYHRQRMELLLNVPALAAHSTLRYEAWRQAIADYAALRLRAAPGDLAPQTIGWAFLATSLAAYEQWLRHDDADLIGLLDAALEVLRELVSGS